MHWPLLHALQEHFMSSIRLTSCGSGRARHLTGMYSPFSALLPFASIGGRSGQLILWCSLHGWYEVTTWHELEVASRLPSSLTEIVPILMMARLLHPLDYKHGTQNVPMPLLVLEAHRCRALLEWNVLQVPWNSIWLGHHHPASGMHWSKCFSYSNESASPVSAREVVQFQKLLAFMMPDDFSSFEYIYFSFSCGLVVLPVKNLSHVEVAMLPWSSSSSSSQYPETKCTVFDLHYWIQKQAPDEESRYRPLRVFVTPRTKTEFPQRFLPKLEVTMVNMRC